VATLALTGWARVLLLALAAWQPGATVRDDRAPTTSVLAIPAAFTLSALGLMIYDHFTPMVLMQLEEYGFCKKGEGGPFVLSGAIRYDAERRPGAIPVNTHGGQLSHGRTHGMGLLHEAITQLRGEAGERQVADARVGVVSSGGLTPSGVLLLRADT